MRLAFRRLNQNKITNSEGEFGQKKHELYTNGKKKSVLESGQKNIVLLLIFLVY